MIRYEQPKTITNEKDLLDDMNSAAIAILEAESALEKDGACSERTIHLLSELAERKRARIKYLEILLEKSSALLERYECTLKTLAQMHSEIESAILL